MYTFNILNLDGAPIALEIIDLSHDGAAIAKAGDLLAEHLSGGCVEIWDGERPVMARYRDAPFIRSIEDSLAQTLTLSESNSRGD